MSCSGKYCCFDGLQRAYYEEGFDSITVPYKVEEEEVEEIWARRTKVEDKEYYLEELPSWSGKERDLMVHVYCDARSVKYLN